ncbi:MAG: aldo/keto reductase [Elusimicrobiota bacterium]
MKVNPLGRSGLKVSALALGTMNFGADWHGIGAIDEKTAAGLLDRALAAGVNLIDTADIYGRGASETMLGKLLGKRRSKVLLASKVLGQMKLGDPASGGLGRKHVRAGLEASLKRLKTDYLDLYMPHGWDQEVPLEETLEALDRAVLAGKVRVVGCSNFSGEELQQALACSAQDHRARFEFDQVQFSLAARFIEGDLVPVAVSGEVGLLAWSPLGGGLLSGKYAGAGPRPAGRWQDPAKAFPPLPEERLAVLIRLLGKVAQLEGVKPVQAALGWVLAKPWIASAVIGARTAEQLSETLAAKPLSTRSVALLDQASALCSIR